MDARTAFWLWYDFSHIAGSAVSTKQHGVDSDDKYIDWGRQNQSMLTAGLSFGCSLFEAMAEKNKWKKPHNSVLNHLRNALLHNGGDITKNNKGDGRALKECRAYVAAELWKAFDPPGPSPQRRRFFSIDSNGQVTLNNALLFFIERLIDSYMSKTERALPPPTRPE